MSIAVEAKSRQRPGVKHRGGVATHEELLRGDVGRLLDRALGQNPNDKPFLIFIDINTLLTPGVPVQEKPWYQDIRNLMDSNPRPTPEAPEKFTGIFFTNFSPHYNAENLSDPHEYLVVIPQYAAYPMPNPVFGELLMRAIQHYGFVPNVLEDKRNWNAIDI